jgi:hypothetical protein
VTLADAAWAVGCTPVVAVWTVWAAA